MPIKYVPYIPEPIEGQAVLRFNRALKYKGSDDVSMTMDRGMPLYEVELQETVGKNPDRNMLIRGECVSACAYLKEQGIEVDLVYIDPPFASGADYAKKVYIRRNPKVAELISKTEEQFLGEEIDSDELRAFEEKMYGDVWDKEKYLNWMYENLMAIKSVMSPKASIYVHLDFHIGHYVKVLMDEIFGEVNYQNDIYWYYYNKLHGATKKVFPRATDMILYYLMDRNAGFVFHHLTEERDKPVKKLKYSFVDGHIKNDKDEEGKSITYISTERQIDNVWRLSMLQPADKTEPVGYATQKPEALLERIIQASSDEDMIVADFFGGSGVAAKVANDYGRKFIHCDIGVNSIQTTRDRLVSSGASFNVLDIKDGVQLYRNPVQTMDKIKSLIPGLKNEDSLDSFWEGSISDSKHGMIPVYVPNLMDSSSKVLDKVTVNRIIHEAIPDLPTGVKKVIVFYIDISNEEDIKKFIQDDDSTTVEIELRDLKNVLDDVVVGDEVEYHVEKNQDDLLGGYNVVIDRFLSDRVISKIMEFNQKSMLNTKKKFTPIEVSDEGLETIEFISLDCTKSSGVWHSDYEIKIDKNGFVILDGEKTKEFWDGRIRTQNSPKRLKIRNICGDETVWIIEE